MFSLVFATMAVMYNDANEVLENGFFQGYDGVVILIVLIQVNKFNSLQDIEGHIEFEKTPKFYEILCQSITM